jgi:hypothetical protein
MLTAAVNSDAIIAAAAAAAFAGCASTISARSPY